MHGEAECWCLLAVAMMIGLITCTDQHNCTGKFHCSDTLCIDMTLTCDMFPDCPDGKDESHAVCEHPSCRGKFKCDDSLCIDHVQTCDGQRHCPDGRDEGFAAGCDQQNCAGKFNCSDSLCIDMSWTCDTVQDCPDGRDESSAVCDREGYSRREVVLALKGEKAIFKSQSKVELEEDFDNQSWTHKCEIFVDYQQYPCFGDDLEEPYAELYIDTSEIAVVLPSISDEEVTVNLYVKQETFEWKVYMLGSSNVTAIANSYLVQSGTNVSLKDFPRINHTVIQRLGYREGWIFNGNLQHSTLEINEEASDKTLTYVVTYDTYNSATADFKISVLHTSSPRCFAGTLVVRDGETFQTTEFPHISTGDARDLGVTESWIYNGTTLSNISFTAYPDMSNQTIVYRLESKQGESIDYTYTIIVLTPSISKQINNTFLVREGSSVRVTDLPHLSPEDCRKMNVTEHWYLNGRDISYHVITVDRAENLSILTYALTGTHMRSARYDYTIAAAYGPSPNITFEPRQSVYIVSYGATIPTVRCEVECFPPCNIVWTKEGEKVTETNTLSVERATGDTTGEYICTAWNNITKDLATKSLFIVMKDGNCSDVVNSLLWVLVFVLTLDCVMLLTYLYRMKKQQDNKGKTGDMSTAVDQETGGRAKPEGATSSKQTFSALRRSDTGAVGESQYHVRVTETYESNSPFSHQTEGLGTWLQWGAGPRERSYRSPDYTCFRVST